MALAASEPSLLRIATASPVRAAFPIFENLSISSLVFSERPNAIA